MSSNPRATSPSRFTRAAHLTEFYPYLINSSKNNDFPKSAPTTARSRTQSISNTIGTINTTNTLQSLLTQNDINKTSSIYNEILTAAEDYRESLGRVAETSANFGNALEKLSKLKGSDGLDDELLNVSGFFYLISNHQEILKSSIKQYFEVPINKEINNFNLKISNNDEAFKSNFKQLLKELRLKEKENLKLSKSKSKSLNLYRSKLLQLTTHLDAIEALKQEYYQESYDLVENSNKKIISQLGTIIRAQVEIYENIARKGWSGGGLDDLIAQSSDPFTPDDDEEELQESEDGAFNQLLGENTAEESKCDISSPFSALKEYDTFIDGNTPEAKSLDSSEDRLSDPLTVRRLNHQESIITLSKEYLKDQSTPTITPLNNQKQIDENDSVKEDDAKEDDLNSRLISALQLDDDNSFSLPIPGSSSKSGDKSDEDENEKSLNDDKPALHYDVRNEWDENSI